MQKLSDDWLKVYEESKFLWENNFYDEAKDVLEKFWKKTGIKTLPQMVLYAYILRSKKMYISLIDFLKETLKIFKNAHELNFLATLYSLLGESYQRIGMSNFAADMFLKSSELEPNVKGKLAEISNAIFARGAWDFTFEEMDCFYQKYRKTLDKLHITPLKQRKYEHKKIRVGYVSGDLHSHPVSDFSGAMFMDYDKKNFEVYIYSLSDIKDNVTQILKSGGGIWRDVFNMEFSKIAKIIYEDEIDILVDLSGHTKNNALPVFSYKPAPVQLSGIGYVLSTGLYRMDGFLTDVYLSPSENSSYFTERLYRLNHTHFCYTPFSRFPPISSPPCLKNNYVTFGSFNNFSKVNDEVLKVWNGILESVSNSKIILKHSIFDSMEGLEFTKHRIKALGGNLDRFEFRGFCNDYLSEYNDIDIALDTFPYTGGATSLEAMMMGAPLVTLEGDRHGSRFGVSFLKNLNLSELIAKNKNEYAQIAVALASDTELILALRQNLRKRMLASPLMDRKNYMRELEGLYERLVLNAINSAYSSKNRDK